MKEQSSVSLFPANRYYSAKCKLHTALTCNLGIESAVAVVIIETAVTRYLDQERNEDATLKFGATRKEKLDVAEAFKSKGVASHVSMRICHAAMWLQDATKHDINPSRTMWALSGDCTEYVTGVKADIARETAKA